MPKPYDLNEIGTEPVYFWRQLRAVLRAVFLVLWFLILFVPLAWMVLCALTPEANLQQTPPRIRIDQFSLENFKNVYRRTDGFFFVWMWNTFYIASLVTALGTFFSALAGYCFAKLRFPGREVIFWIIMAALMVPYQAIVLPLFVVVNNMLGLTDTHWALILPQLAVPFGIFLCRQQMQGMPSDLIDSARMDGSSEFGIFWRVVLPLSKPILAVLGIYLFIHNWTNFFWPLIVLRSESKFVLEVGLSYFQDTSLFLNADLMAAATLGALPMVVFFIIFHRQMYRGLVLGTWRG